MLAWKPIWFAVLVILLCASATGGTTNRIFAGSDTTLVDYLHTTLGAAERSAPARPSVVVLFDFLRFGCVPCLNDFLDLCDTLRQFRGDPPSFSIHLLIRRNDQPAGDQEREMRSWLRSSGTDLPFHLVPGEAFNRYGLTDVTVLLLDAAGAFEHIARLPKTGAERADIVRRVKSLASSGMNKP